MGSVDLGIIGEQEDGGIAPTVRDLKRKETVKMQNIAIEAFLKTDKTESLVPSNRDKEGHGP